MSYVLDKERERVLMIKKFKRENDPNSGLFTLPGGKINDGEMENSHGKLESAVRECEEETGIKMINPSIRGQITFLNEERIFDNWDNPEDYYIYLFSTEEYGGTLKAGDEGIPLWIPKKRILDLPKNSGDNIFYEALLSRDDYFVGEIKYKGKEVVSEESFVDFIN